MKGLFKKLLLVACSCAVAFGFVFTPVSVSAEEVTKATEIEAEISGKTEENGAVEETPEAEDDVVGLSYYVTVSEEKRVRLDFLDLSNVNCVMFLDGIEVATVRASYTKLKNVVDIYAMDDYWGTFRLNADGTATEIFNQETEIGTEQEPEKPKEITLDDLLVLVGNLAEDEGLGEEWNDWMEQLKLALEDKKIDATLIVNILILSAIIGYLIFKTFGRAVAWIKRKKNPSTVAEDLQGVKKTSIAQTEAVNKQTKAINALAETDEHMAQTVEKENAKLNALAAAQIEMNSALRTLIRGTNIKAELKDEAYRALNKSNEHCDNAQK